MQASRSIFQVASNCVGSRCILRLLFQLYAFAFHFGLQCCQLFLRVEQRIADVVQQFAGGILIQPVRSGSSDLAQPRRLNRIQSGNSVRMVHKNRATSNAPLPAITHIHHIKEDMVPYRQLCKSYSVPPQPCCANSVSHQPHNEGSSDSVKQLYPPVRMVQSMDMPAYSAASLPNTQAPCQRFCHVKTVGVSKAVGIRRTSHMLMNWRISPMLGLYSEVCDAMANLLYSAGQNRYTAAAAHKIAKNVCRLPALGSALHAFQILNSERASDRTNNMPIRIAVINAVIQTFSPIVLRSCFLVLQISRFVFR